MPRAKKKTEDEEIEDLIEDLDDEEEVEEDEELEDDEDVEEEDEEEEDEEEEDDEELEEEDEEDEEEEDPDEAPVKARSRKKSTAKKAERPERTGIGTAELADAAGIDSRTLRMYLRAKGFEKTEGRYEWKSLNDPQAKQILKGLRDKEHKVVQKERLDGMKTRKPASKAPAKKPTAKSRAGAAAKTTTRRKR